MKNLFKNIPVSTPVSVISEYGVQFSAFLREKYEAFFVTVGPVITFCTANDRDELLYKLFDTDQIDFIDPENGKTVHCYIIRTFRNGNILTLDADNDQGDFKIRDFSDLATFGDTMGLLSMMETFLYKTQPS